jgi:hypothetical protein
MKRKISLSLRTRIYVSLAVIILLVGVGSLFLHTTADALPADGTHTKIYDFCGPGCTQIGFRHEDCEGNITTQWGVQSSGCMNIATYGCEPAF